MPRAAPPLIPALILAGLVAAAPGAQAHHSLAHYDSARPLTLEGVVSEFRYANPHPFLIIAVKGAGGATQSWRLEMDNLYELDAIGLNRDSFRPGDRVEVMGSPSRDQSHSLYLRRLDRPRDGLRYEQAGFTPSVSIRGK